MNRIKDFLYDKNDVLVALIILSLAAFVILSRVDIIMAYPERMALASLPENNQTLPPQERPPLSAIGEENGEITGEENSENGEGNGENGEGNGETGENGEYPYAEPNGNEDPNGTEPVTGAFTLYIASGQSMAVVGRNLVSLGLFESEQQFSAALITNNAAHRVRAGNFIIPRGSSHEDVIRIITANPTGP
jgi:hypothetical protein